MKLALYGETIDLIGQYVFKLLIDAVEVERKRYGELCADIDRILLVYEDKFPELVKELHRLKLEIRLITTGTPTTEPLDSVSSDSVLMSDPNFNARQYNAISVMLKDAYRKAAMVTHPDRPNGSEDLFAQVKQAYNERDLAHLIYLYLSVSAFRNLYWRQSEEGISFASTELDRYTSSFQKMKSSEAFKVARFHIIGFPWKAETQMQSVLLKEIERYSNELNFLREQNANHQQETSIENSSEESGDEDVGQSSADHSRKEEIDWSQTRRKESDTRSQESSADQESDRGYDSTGESPAGSQEWDS